MLMIEVDRVTEIIENCRNKKIAVVGDVMLDRYFWGSVSRISPEAPVPVIDLDKETFHLGGAANVANNLKSLGLEPILCGLIGEDRSGKMFKDIVKDFGVNPAGLYEDPDRPTTVKTRIIGNNQQIARLDRELRKSISHQGEKFILESLHEINNLAGIIFEDYNKGTITKDLIEKIIAFSSEKNIPVYVDPKFDNFFNYKNCFLFKPNKKEAQQALDQNINSKEDAIEAGRAIIERLQCRNLLITLGADGMILFEENGNISTVPTRARHIADVSGAGDTAIATIAAAIAGGATMKEAASIANYAAGAVCEEPGIVSITPSSLYLAVSKSVHNNEKSI